MEPVFGKHNDEVSRLLVAAMKEGNVARGKVAVIVGKGETVAREILQKAMNAGLLKSDTPKGPVRLAFPAKVLDAYFPKLAQTE